VKRFARLSVRHRLLAVLTWIVILLAVNGAARAAGSAYANTFSLPGTNSARAFALLGSIKGGQGDVDEIVYHVSRGTLQDQSARIEASLARVAKLPQIATVSPPFCVGATPCAASAQVSRDGRTGYAIVHFTEPGFRLRDSQISEVLTTAATARSKVLEVEFGGNAFGQHYAPKGSRGEIFGLIATAIVLILAFGSLMAMLLPLGVALVALGVAAAATELLSHGLAIAQFAPILGSLIGLGVGVDYALFIVTRTRQNLQRGLSVEEAVVNAVDTSGRAVLFAGSTVCIALLGMLVLRLSFLNGVAVSATVTVAITMAASLTRLPALRAMMGPRVLSRRERRRLASEGPARSEDAGGWRRWSEFVSRHPRVLSLAALVAIVMVAVPATSLRLGSSDQGSNPPGSTTRLAYDLLAKGFGPGFNGPLTIVGRVRTPADRAAMGRVDAAARHLKGVAAVGPVVPLDKGSVALISVVPTTSPQDAATSDLIARLRHVVIPRATQASHTAIYVGGITAIFDDFAAVLGSKIPLFLAVIVALGCLLLMVAFRSVVVPLVAAVMNLLAAAASFGLVVAVFQWGWGSRLLQAGTGPVESFLPVIMIAILFGLSMDYQVFLVSRMHEEWVHTGDNETAIVRGQAATGRVITAAALIMISVFSSFSFGGQRIIAEFGVGLAGAVALDAFIVRTVLVPALMHFLGRANWWMPAWLERVVPHVAVEAADEP
jgi:RND superfamily putative drug exporter